MRLRSKFKALRNPQLLVALLLIVGLLMPGLPAQAIHGNITRNDVPPHPYVGGVWITAAGFDIPPERVRANGILIARNVVLTEAGSYQNGRRVAVSFANPITDFQDDPGDSVYSGYVYHHPNVDFNNSFSMRDLAVIILDDEVQGIDPASLAEIGALDPQQQGNGPRTLTAVGYGPTSFDSDETEPPSFPRLASDWRREAVTQSTVHIQAPGQNFACDGDQGTPLLHWQDTAEAVVALLMNWRGNCRAYSAAYAYRVDTQEAWDFMCDVGNTNFTAVEVDDPANPGQTVPYSDLTSASQTSLVDNYCPVGESAAQAAAMDDGGKQAADSGADQNADRQHKNKSKHGGNHRHHGKHRH